MTIFLNIGIYMHLRNQPRQGESNFQAEAAQLFSSSTRQESR